MNAYIISIDELQKDIEYNETKEYNWPICLFFTGKGKPAKDIKHAFKFNAQFMTPNNGLYSFFNWNMN